MADSGTCANCGAARSGPFCSQCGQKDRDLHRPIWWIIGEFLDAVFSYDSRTFRTLWLLVALPGEFTRRYMAGQRASLLPPFRLFVIATALFFVTLQLTAVSLIAVSPPSTGKEDVVDIDFLVPRPQGDAVPITAAQRKAMEEVRRNIASGDVVVGEEGANKKEVIAYVTQLWSGIEKIMEDPLRINGPLGVWLPRLMLVLVPLLALMLAAVHWKPRVFLLEHLVFSLHLHTTMFMALTLAAVEAALTGGRGIGWVLGPAFLVYALIAMKRVYRRGWLLSVVKFAALLFLYLFLLLVGLSVVILFVLQEI
jgi:hypothetical protein